MSCSPITRRRLSAPRARIMDYETVQKDVLYLHDPTLPTVSLQIQALAYNTKKMKPAICRRAGKKWPTPKYKGMIALDDPMRAGPLSSMLAGLKTQWKDDARFNNFFAGSKSARRAGAQEHQRNVSSGDLRRIRDLHAGSAARCHGRNAQGHAGELRQNRAAGGVPAPSRHLRQSAEPQCRETFR